MRFSLSPGHYAARWSRKEILTIEDVTQLGILYHGLPDGPRRKDVFLQIVQSFHNYVLKYTDMMRRGHLPSYWSHINKDSVLFLRMFLPSGQDPSKINLQRSCRMLHLAFQNLPYDEIYNILAGMVLKAIHGSVPVTVFVSPAPSKKSCSFAPRGSHAAEPATFIYPLRKETTVFAVRNMHVFLTSDKQHVTTVRKKE
jgi:hypothetical protein